MNKVFESTFGYKVIYVFEIRDEQHKGLLKIGDTTIQTDKNIDELFPNSHDLNKAANKRIKEYTNTAAIDFKLLHTELAIKTITDNEGNMKLEAFRDNHVHRVLTNSGINKVKINNSTSREWFDVDLDTVKRAIDAVKKNKPNLGQVNVDNYVPIVFRPEQIEAIKKTVTQFKTNNRMLWNAKMRFGKTLSALQVVKECGFKKTIIITHRPVVDYGWFDDFGKIFNSEDNYEYGSKNNGATIDYLISTNKSFIYFASMQDLRESSYVGGKYDKNDKVFLTDWDFVIIDEAHEGTTTELGIDVINNIIKENTKLLELSGTPFNILNKYDDNIYTWDYVMEQRCKKQWNELHFGDSNPYDELPEMKIFTYDLGDIISDKKYVELEDKAFNFREFFRTWTGNVEIDGRLLPSDKKVGDFYHYEDVQSFLNLITRESPKSNYPYANKEFRDLFKHSLWMVPGIKEARALSKMMNEHPVFGSGMFKVVNVAGDGDEEEKSEDALKKVKDAIKESGDGYTITLSCGKLTTGVTVPEWTAVFMLAGSYSTSAANYLQTIFRVQSPCNINGKIKRCCYVFDFAPDRTLKMVAESVALSTKAGKATDSDKRIMGEFLNYCPVISIDGTNMKSYNTNRLLEQLKRAYAERAVRNGFDDTNIYNDELLKLDDLDIEKFNELKGIVGKTKASHKTTEVDINHQGFTEEDYEEIERIRSKPKKKRTKEEEERLKRLDEQKKQRANAISILRGISIRIPLLIYGANVNINEDITIDRLVDIVDDSSWEEFMPNGVTKELFKKFIKYYDAEVFVAAGRKIRNTVVSADKLLPMERIKKITELFNCFKNPDKETVLTPWRVVNIHMSDCLGGYDFYDEEHKSIIETPRYIEKKEVTENVLNKEDTKILEINSKTGLYPLYLTYSVYRNKCNQYSKKELTAEKKNDLWNQTIKENIFVICKTPMAKQITKRTLVGFNDIKVNAHYFDDLINMLKNKPKQFVERVTRPSYWNVKGVDTMKFDAIVGNPPYQIMDGGNAASASPVYNYFVEQAKSINPKYLSMIVPARWYVGGKGLDSFRSDMLNDKRMTVLVDYPNSNDIFPTVDIAGGICYFLWNKDNKERDCVVVNCNKGERDSMNRSLSEYDIFVRSNKALSILKKIVNIHKGRFLDEIVSPRKPFGLPTNYKPREDGIPCCFIKKIGIKYAKKEDVDDSRGYLNKWKFVAPKSPIAGQTDFTKPIGFYYDGNTQILPPGTCCTESYIILYAADTKEEIVSFKSYIFTKVARFMLLQSVVSQDVTRDRFRFVPHLEKYVGTYNDKMLCSRWNISDDEWQFIDSCIKNINK